jgi:hypothetical protein
MARVNVRHSFDMGAVRVMQTNPVGGVARDMYRRGQNVRAEAQRLAGEDTGRLRASIHVEHVERNGVVGARVGSNVEYAAAHHEGTARWSPAVRAGSWYSGPGAGRWSSRRRFDPSRGPRIFVVRSRRPGTSPAGLAGSAGQHPSGRRDDRAPAPWWMPALGRPRLAAQRDYWGPHWMSVTARE